VILDCLDGLDRLKVSWFSGSLILPHGRIIYISYIHSFSIYENYKILEIENGNLISETDIDYNQYIEKYGNDFP
jgi:hypothetical protein